MVMNLRFILSAVQGIMQESGMISFTCLKDYSGCFMINGQGKAREDAQRAGISGCVETVHLDFHQAKVLITLRTSRRNWGSSAVCSGKFVVNRTRGCATLNKKDNQYVRLKKKKRFKTISTVMEQRVTTQKVNVIEVNIIF